MFELQGALHKIGINSKIFAETIHPELNGRIELFDKHLVEENDILIIRHSFENGLIDKVLSTPCRKILLYHNITKPDFFSKNDPLRAAAITAYQQLWQLKDAIDGAICDSEFNASALRQRGFSNVKSICLLSNFKDLPSKPYVGEPFNHFDDVWHLLFVGRICPNKGQHHLVRAIPRIEERLGKKVRLTLCGHADHGNSYLDLINGIIKKHDLHNQVQIRGSVSNEQLYGYYRAADAYVSYSQHEGFGVPLIEAMAFGTPVFAYATTAVPRTLGGAGHLLETLDPDELCDAFEMVFKSRTSRRRFISKQRCRAVDLSIENTFTSLIEFLADLYPSKYVLRDILPQATPRAARTEQVIVEGPLAGSYSLSQVNRALVAAIDKGPDRQVVALPREGTDDYRFDFKELNRSPELLEPLRRKVDISARTISLRNMYPPRVRGNISDIRLHYLYWEESRLPVDIVRQINMQLDGLLAPTNYCAKVFRDSGVHVPIAVVGSGLVTNHRVTPPKPWKKPFIFLHVSSGLPRKGIRELIQAYVTAFSKQDDVLLVIKSYENVSSIIDETMVEIYNGAGNAPQIIVNNDNLSEEEMARLYSLADAIVLPTRGEGFNLPAAECLAAGKLLLVTGTGAHMDFCNEQNSILLNYSYEYSTSHLAEATSYWAVVNVQDLAMQLRRARANEISVVPELSYPCKDWNVVVENIMTFAETIDSDRPLKETIKIASISTFNTKCGIAVYNAAICRSLSKTIFDVQFWATNESSLDLCKEASSVLRIWQHLDGNFHILCQKAVDENFDAVLVQFNFGFFELDDLVKGLNILKSNQVPLHIVFHKTSDSFIGSRKVSLSTCADELKIVDRIYVHSVDDVNYLQSLDIHNNVTLIPLYIDEYPRLPASGIRAALGLPVGAPVVATNGFLLPNKGVIDLILAFALFKKQFDQAHLILATAVFPAKDSEDLADTCRQLIQSLDLSSSVTMMTDFMDLEQINILLSAADVIVYPYGYSEESASASVRQGLAARRPVVGTKTPIFSNIQNVIDIIDDVTPVGICRRISEIIGDAGLRDQIKNRIEAFCRGQGPDDVAMIISANIQHDIMNSKNVEFPLISSADRQSETPYPASSAEILAYSEIVKRDLSSAERKYVSDFANAADDVFADVLLSLHVGDEPFDLARAQLSSMNVLKAPTDEVGRLHHLDGDQFVEGCYKLLLGRGVDEGGRETFNNILLSDPHHGKTRVIHAILQSEEFKIRIRREITQ
ncbi:glycosyltransferase family 4 protein [Methylorubrum aminovorans]|nr:glycosyltransferase [Methylorubrum aminovorans]